LFTQPHQEHGAARQGHNRRGDEEHPRRIDEALRGVQADGNTEGLSQSQHNRQIAGVLVQLFATCFAAFLFQLLPRRIHRTHQLHDDRSRDIRHNVQREDSHTFHSATREHVEHVQDAALAVRVLEELEEGIGIDARDRHIGTETIDQQSAQREQQALVELGRLRERTHVHICCKLFSGRSHMLSPRL